VRFSLRRWAFAALYDRMTAAQEPEVAPLRRKTVGRAHGAVLEIGAGTGANLPYYPRDAHLTTLEPNQAMASRLKQKAEALGRSVQVDVHEGERLPYADSVFDAVVVSLVLCSVPDQQAMLAEVKRVLRPGGVFLFVEHVASRDERVRRWQRRLSPIQRFIADGCELDRDTGAAIRAAGFGSADIEEVDLAGLPALTRHVVLGAATT
jgi:ubiquinone/menaquinone biosynthesis C-methylase UbiE